MVQNAPGGGITFLVGVVDGGRWASAQVEEEEDGISPELNLKTAYKLQSDEWWKKY